MGVKRAGRLVCEYKVWIDRKRAGTGAALPLSSWHFMRKFVQNSGNTKGFGNFLYCLRNVFFGERLYSQRKCDIFIEGQNRECQSKQAFFAQILKKLEWIEGENHDVLETVTP